MSNYFERHIDCWDGYLKKIASQFVVPWNAIQSIQQMHNEGNATLQTEWQGWFTEHKLENHPQNTIPEFKVHSKILHPEDRILDAFYENLGARFPVDIKTTSGHKLNKHGVLVYNPGSIMLNDEETTLEVLEKYGATGILLVSGLATMEDLELRETKEFLSKLKEIRDGASHSDYALQNREKGKKSRLLKKEFQPLRIEVHLWTAADFNRHVKEKNLIALDQPGLNSNGKPRPRKYNMKVANISPLVSLDFMGEDKIKITQNREYITKIGN